MIRIFTTLFVVLLAIRVCLANSGIVLISPSAAGPDVRPETYSHPLWVTWPKATDGSGVNQVVSIATGQVLNLKETNFVFQANSNGSFTNRAQKSLEEFSLPYPMFTIHNLYAVRSGSSGIDQRLLAMASCEDIGPKIVDKVESKGDRVYALKANSWDEVVSFSSKIDGDTVVLEFPPLPGHLWSRVWLYRGGKIKSSLPFGVIASTSIKTLVEAQGPFEPSHIYDPGNSAKTGAPDRWLAVGEYGKAISIGLFSLLWGAIFWSLGFLSQEVSSLTSRLGFYLATSVCFAIKFSPALILWTGIQLWWFWLVFLTGIFVATFCVADINGKEGGIPPLIQIGLPLCILSGFIRPEVSPFGPIYGTDGGLKAFNGAFELALGIYFLIWSHRKSGLWWLACLAALPVMGVQSAYFSSWSISMVYFASVLAFFVPAKPLKWWITGSFLLLAIVAVASHDGVDFSRNVDFDGLHRDRLNYFVLVPQLLRPEVGIGLLASVCAIAFASRFEYYRLKRTWKESKIVAPLFWGCLFILIWTVGFPNVFGALPWAGTFAFLLWSQEALGKL